MPRASRRRSLAVLGAVWCLPVLLPWCGPTGMVPIAQAQAACTVGHQLRAAVGVPGESIGSTTGAGVVEVRYTCKVDHAPQALRLPTPDAGDHFGASVTRGYFNNDDDEDVAVGVPGLDVAGHRNAGGVALFYGSKTGLKFGRLITQATAGVPGAVQTGAHFGSAVAADGYAPDRVYVVRIGEPGKTVAGHTRAGGFVDLPYVRGKLTKPREVTLATPGVPGAPGTGDRLGAAVTGSYAAGAPGRTVDGQAGAGAVLVAYLPPSDTPRARGATLLTQASRGIAGAPEAGDHFGAALSRHWIGAPGEAVGDVAGAGVVDRYYYGSYGDNPGFSPIAIVQGSDGVPGAVQSDAHFGAALGELGVYVDDTEWFAKDLLVGAPGQSVGGKSGAGSVTAIGVTEPDPDGGNTFSFNGQYQVLTAADPQTGAAFGTSIARLDEETAAVGAPVAGGGQVSVFEAIDLDQLPMTLDATWTQQAGTPETGDAYGASLAGPPN